MNLEQEIGQMLIASKKTMATAESTCGGYIGHLINNVPGSSKYYIGSIVAYHTKPKIKLLNVPVDVFNTFGSVSAQCALAMAKGAREAMGADIGVSETGIAGPTLGTPERPAGTVFIAISTSDSYELVERNVWDTNRDGFKKRTAEAVLTLIRQYLEK